MKSVTDESRRQLALRIDAALHEARGKGVTASSIAKSLGVNPATVSTWRNPDKRALPSRDNLQRLAKVLSLPLAHFDITRSNSPAPVSGLGRVPENEMLRVLRATLDKWRDAERRAERYHALMLDAKTPSEGDTLEGVRERLLDAVVAESPDPSVFHVVVKAWERASLLPVRPSNSLGNRHWGIRTGVQFPF